MSECDFCRIVRGDDATPLRVAEGDDWIAFFPDTPATPGHTLIVPRLHVESIWEAPAPLAAALMIATIKVGRAIREALNPEGLNLIHSAGSVAEQTVFHLHLHVVPRWRNDELGSIWPPKRPTAPDVLEVMHQAISSAYQRRVRAP